MQIHELRSPYRRKVKKKVGRGGKRGTTSGKGQKGQRSRAGHRIRPAERDMLSRLPKLRGVKNRSLKPKPLALSLGRLSKLGLGVVSLRSLKGARVIKSERQRVKIVSDGEMSNVFTVVGIPVSEKAKEKIIKAGGKVVG